MMGHTIPGTTPGIAPGGWSSSHNAPWDALDALRAMTNSGGPGRSWSDEAAFLTRLGSAQPGRGRRRRERVGREPTALVVAEQVPQVRWSDLAISLGFGLALVVAVAPRGGRALSRGRGGLLLA